MSEIVLDAKIPAGPVAEKWDNYKADMKLVNPNNKRKFKVLVVGSGLAGASAAATLAELGYQVDVFTFHDSPRRAHAIAAQGGINAAKNYHGDGDSIHRLFYDTVKGGDFRAREGNVYRLAQVSGNIIDQMVAQGVPFAREYGGMLDNRSFGGAQVSRTFYARGQTGQQLLLGAYQQLARQIGLGNVNLWNRTELVDVVTVDGRCAGIVTRDLVTGEVCSHSGHAVVMATGGYGNVFFLSTNAMSCNVTAAWRAHRKGAFFANPCYTQIHPTCIPQADDTQSKLTLMSESLRNDGRVWVPLNEGDAPPAARDPRGRARLLPRAPLPELRQSCAARHLVACRQASRRQRPRRRPAEERRLPRLLRRPSAVSASRVVQERYGNLFEMYERITGENPYDVPMRIYPASHYTMGGLWVDYELMTTIPGLYAAGEANFSDHGANRLRRLGPHAGPGRRLLRAALHHRQLPGTDAQPADPRHRSPRVQGRRGGRHGRGSSGYLDISGTRSPDWFHRELGKIIWDYCGMERTEEGLQTGPRANCPPCTRSSRRDLRVTGDGAGVNQTLEKAGRVDDFFQLGMLMCRDALERKESCGGHFRAEYQDDRGRGPARRRELRPRRRVGVDGRPDGSRPPQGRTRIRRQSTSPSGATSESSSGKPDPQDLASERPGRSAATSRATASTRSATRLRSSRCSTCSTRS